MKHSDDIRALYLSAFPAEERRPWEEVLRLHRDEPMFTLHPLELDNGTFAGFITVWEMPEGFRYVEHFAVRPDLRGHGLGGMALERIVGAPAVLEVELPDTDQARRRIDFYARHGFIVGKADYVQPPYTDSLPSLPMYLLTRGDVDPEAAARRLHHTVYQATECL